MTWKGTEVTRFAALQAAGTSGDQFVWGEFWTEGLASLGADVGAASETRMWKDGDIEQAKRGIARKGFTAIAHGVAPKRRGIESEGVDWSQSKPRITCAIP